MKKVAALLTLALVSATLVACGDDEGTTTTPTGTGGEATNGAATGGGEKDERSIILFKVAPDGGLAYTFDEATAKAGNVVVEFRNEQPITHDVRFEDSNGNDVGGTQALPEGYEAITLAELKPGEYTFYCSVPGHREAGMEGALTVE